MSESPQALKGADELFRSREYEDAGTAYEKLAELAASETESSIQVEALAQVARCFSIRKLADQGKPWLDRASSLATEDQPLGWTRYLIVRGVYEREAGDRQAAQKTFLQCYEFCMAHDMHQRAIDAAHHLAIAAVPEDQIKWAALGIEAAEKGGYDAWLAILWNNLGWTYDELKRYPEALDALGKAREYHKKTGSDHSKLVADWSLGHAKRMVGNLDEARAILDDTLATATKRFEESPSNDTREWVGQCYWELGEVAAASGDPAQGLRLLNRARDELVKAEIEKWWAEGLQKLDARIAQFK